MTTKKPTKARYPPTHGKGRYWTKEAALRAPKAPRESPGACVFFRLEEGGKKGKAEAQKKRGGGGAWEGGGGPDFFRVFFPSFSLFPPLFPLTDEERRRGQRRQRRRHRRGPARPHFAALVGDPGRDRGQDDQRSVLGLRHGEREARERAEHRLVHGARQEGQLGDVRQVGSEHRPRAVDDDGEGDERRETDEGVDGPVDQGVGELSAAALGGGGGGRCCCCCR